MTELKNIERLLLHKSQENILLGLHLIEHDKKWVTDLKYHLIVVYVFNEDDEIRVKLWEILHRYFDENNVRTLLEPLLIFTKFYS